MCLNHNDLNSLVVFVSARTFMVSWLIYVEVLTKSCVMICGYSSFIRSEITKSALGSAVNAGKRWKRA